MVERLERAGIDCVIFGGWANELTGAITPRSHKDLDLLYIADNFERVDAFMHSQRDIAEIPAKHFPHKRAFLCEGVMTEILLLSPKKTSFVTRFWNEFELEWPELSTVYITIQGRKLIVSAPHVVEYYQKHEREIAGVRARYAQAVIPPLGR